MYLAIIISLLIFSKLSFAHELSLKFNGEDSKCTAHCSSATSGGSGTSIDKTSDLSAEGAVDDMACKNVLNQSYANAKSLKDVQTGIVSVTHSVESIHNFTMETSELVGDIQNRLEEFIRMYNKSENKGVSDKKHIFNDLEGVRYTRFWWYNDTEGKGWPEDEIDVLEKSYGTCDEDSYYCFGRLPQTLNEAKSELVAIDSAGNVYRWKFNPSNPTAHSVWKAFYSHVDQKIRNNAAWNPEVIRGSAPTQTQDSFMYRLQNGVKSVLLDDDTCDCHSTLSMGHGMCGGGHEPNYGPANIYGVDLLYDNGCSSPNPTYGLTLYFKD